MSSQNAQGLTDSPSPSFIPTGRQARAPDPLGRIAWSCSSLGSALFPPRAGLAPSRPGQVVTRSSSLTRWPGGGWGVTPREGTCCLAELPTLHHSQAEALGGSLMRRGHFCRPRGSPCTEGFRLVPTQTAACQLQSLPPSLERRPARAESQPRGSAALVSSHGMTLSLVCPSVVGDRSPFW